MEAEAKNSQTTGSEDPKLTPAAEPEKEPQAEQLAAEAAAIEDQAERMKQEEQTRQTQQASVPEPVAVPAAAVAVPSEVRQLRSKVTLLSVVTALVIAGCAAGAFYFNSQMSVTVRDAQTLKTASETAVARADKLVDTFSTQSDRMQELLLENDKLIDANGALKDTIDKLAVRLNSVEGALASAQKEIQRYEQRNPDDWKLAQAYFLVNSAFQMAVFSSDIASAVWCLKDADSMLTGIEDDDVIKLRQAISNDLMKLGNLPSIDVRGISFRLDSIYQNLDAMTLNGLTARLEEKNTFERPASEQASLDHWKENLFASVKSFSENFIEIRRRDDNALNQFLSATQAESLKQNIRSLLLLTKQALYQGDQAAFRNSIAQAQDLIRAYYDSNNEAYKTNLDALDGLKDLQIAVDVPSVLSSYSLFKDVAAKRIRMISADTPAPRAAEAESTATDTQEAASK